MKTGYDNVRKKDRDNDSSGWIEHILRRRVPGTHTVSRIVALSNVGTGPLFVCRRSLSTFLLLGMTFWSLSCCFNAGATQEGALDDLSHLRVAPPLDVDPSGSVRVSLAPERWHVAVCVAAPFIYLTILAWGISKKRWAVFLLPLVGALSLDAASMDENRFLWEEAEVQMTLAETPADFLSASRTYDRLLRNGVRNGPLCYNHGIALLKANQPKQAFHSLERAECFLGARCDIRHGMAMAAMALEEEGQTMERWPRMLFFWHFLFGFRTRMALAVCAYAGVWIGLTLRLFSCTRSARPVFVVSLLLMVGFGSSVGVSLVSETERSRSDSQRAASGGQNPAYDIQPAIPQPQGRPDAEEPADNRDGPVGTGDPPSLPMSHPLSPTNGMLPVIARLETSITNPYCFQDFDLMLTLEFTGIRLGKSIQIDGLPAPDEFLREPFRELSPYQDVQDGRVHEQRRYVTRARALKPGKLTGNPELLVPVIDPQSVYGLDDAETIMRIPLDPIDLDVRRLPSADRPSTFGGAVGDFTLQVSVAPTNVFVDEPVKIVMQVEGQGHFERLMPGRVSVAPHFRIDDPRPIACAPPCIAACEQVLTPQSTNASIIPAVEFSYFEPVKGEYVTLARGPFLLRFRPEPENRYAYFAPSHYAKATFKLPEGRRISVLGRDGDWRKIRVDHRIGWIPGRSVIH